MARHVRNPDGHRDEMLESAFGCAELDHAGTTEAAVTAVFGAERCRQIHG